MNIRIRIFALMPVTAFLVMISASAFAALYAGESNRVETFGVVSDANQEAGSITITVNIAKKGLQNNFGEDVTFCINNAVVVDTCSQKTYNVSDCWSRLSENVGKEGREAERGERKLELSQIRDGDWVFVSGYFDQYTGSFVAEKILRLPS